MWLFGRGLDVYGKGDNVESTDDKSTEEDEDDKSYKEELIEIWEETQEIEDPVERAKFLDEELAGKQRTVLAEIIVNAVATDMGEELP